MKISEVSNGSEVKIHAAISGHSIVLMTEAIFGVQAGLLVKPMEYFGKYMQFLEPSNVEIRNKRDGRVYKFMSTTITPVKTRYGNFHLIKSSSKLEPENTRKAERFNIEKLGLMSVNGDIINLKNCIVHDISMRGISILIDDATKLKIGDRLDIMFRYGELLHNYEVSTIVVRYFEVQGKKAVGCSITNLNVDLIGLIMNKKNEIHPPVTEASEAGLNPEVPEHQQIKEVEEDLAKELIPERSKTLNLKSNGSNPFDPNNLEHISSSDKTLRQVRQEERQAQQAKEIENLLDLRDI